MNFKNMDEVRPGDVANGDCFAVKIVAVAGQANDWAAYRGLSSWTDEEVARGGSKLTEDQAVPLFYVLRNSGRTYRP